MTDATELDTAAIRARLEAATPGPWHIGPDSAGQATAVRGPKRDHVASCQYDEDLEFIAHARTDVELLLAALDEAQAERDTHREVAESMTGLWEQEKDRASRLEAMADRLADRRANHEPWHCCCAEGSHAGQAAALNRMKARAEAAESALAAVKALADDMAETLRSREREALNEGGPRPSAERVEAFDYAVGVAQDWLLEEIAALTAPTTPEETQP